MYYLVDGLFGYVENSLLPQWVAPFLLQKVECFIQERPENVVQVAFDWKFIGVQIVIIPEC